MTNYIRNELTEHHLNVLKDKGILDNEQYTSFSNKIRNGLTQDEKILIRKLYAQFQRKRWDAESDSMLIELWGKHNWRFIADYFGKSYNSIKMRAKRLGLTIENKRIRGGWEVWQDNILTENKEKLNSTQIAKMVGRTSGAVRGRIKTLNRKRVKI